MSEIYTQIVALEEGKPYIPGAEEYVIRADHTIADIARWVIDNDWDDDMVHLLLERGQ